MCRLFIFMERGEFVPFLLGFGAPKATTSIYIAMHHYNSDTLLDLGLQHWETPQEAPAGFKHQGEVVHT